MLRPEIRCELAGIRRGFHRPRQLGIKEQQVLMKPDDSIFVPVSRTLLLILIMVIDIA
ncbi:hypothetical protein D3C86_2138420 [compost metagenome]